MLEGYIEAATHYIALLAEGIAAMVIAIGLVRVLLRYLWNLTAKGDISRVRIRLELAQSLALALELLVAADILRTAVAPTWDLIGQLGAIVSIRIVLNYFIQREIEHERTVLRELSSDTA